MTQSLFLGAYWPAREETIGECAERLKAFLAQIAHVDEALATWYQRGRSRKDAQSSAVDVEDRTALIGILEKGRNRRDIGNEVIESLGFRIGFWNGSKNESEDASLSILCGAFSHNVRNSVALNLPSTFSSLGFEVKVLEILSITCSIWQPDWAGVMSSEAMNTRKFSARKPFVDWMVFVPRSIECVPSPATVSPLVTGGSVIVTQSQPPLPHDTEAQTRIRVIEELIIA